MPHEALLTAVDHVRMTYEHALDVARWAEYLTPEARGRVLDHLAASYPEAVAAAIEDLGLREPFAQTAPQRAAEDTACSKCHHFACPGDCRDCPSCDAEPGPFDVASDVDPYAIPPNRIGEVTPPPTRDLFEAYGFGHHAAEITP